MSIAQHWQDATACHSSMQLTCTHMRSPMHSPAFIYTALQSSGRQRLKAHNIYSFTRQRSALMQHKTAFTHLPEVFGILAAHSFALQRTSGCTDPAPTILGLLHGLLASAIEVNSSSGLK